MASSGKCAPDVAPDKYNFDVFICNFGDVKPARSGVSEMRIDYGPGYRVYFFRRGGDKRTQKADIAQAVRMKDEIERRGGDKAV